jgi:hypothetical protein
MKLTRNFNRPEGGWNPSFRVARMIGFLLLVVVFLAGCRGSFRILHTCGPDSNDLLRTLSSRARFRVYTHPTPLDAARSAKSGEAILLPAGSYPDGTLSLSPEFFALVKAKNIRTYVEYPSYLPGLTTGQPVKNQLERGVVNSSFFGRGADSLSILVVNGMHHVPVDPVKSLIVAARVAGFDRALFGLPDQTAPLLFELPGYPVMVSTTSLTRMIRGRFAPYDEWKQVWQGILAYLFPGKKPEPVKWVPSVIPTYGRTAALPEGYQKRAVKRAAEWYQNAGIIIDEGTKGSYEAILSVIDENGEQPVGMVKRGDCISETAMAFSTAGTLLGKPAYQRIATNLLDYYLVHSTAARNEWADPESGAYGLIPWGITSYAWYRANYGDDNARLMLALMVTSALNQTDRWDTILMRCLLAQLRTTGINGFRGDRIDLPDFARNGWKYYFNDQIINPEPHFEAYLWACFLWAYDKTGYQLFLERAEKGIRIMMEKYPDGWTWTNGMAQEKARMILPLAWLVRVKDTPEFRGYLNRMVGDLLKLQDSSGAIREEIGDLSRGRYPPPQSNDAYGTNEASLIGENGDKVSDLLYTTNFAFLGLHEAAAATGDSVIQAAEDRLARFLCRIQVASPSHPELNGGWFRAFDFGRYEHWGCNADQGWGAWCIESGWTEGWITSILGLREMGTSVWDLTRISQAANVFTPLRKQMLPGYP